MFCLTQKGNMTPAWWGNTHRNPNIAVKPKSNVVFSLLKY